MSSDTETPGPYGWSPTPAHITRVEQELTRQRKQTARRRTETREQAAR